MKQKKFDVVNILLTIMLTLLSAACLYPILYVAYRSLFSGIPMAQTDFFASLSLDAYRSVFQNKNIFIGYRNTIFYVGFGTLAGVLLTVMAGYVLAQKWLLGRGFFMWVVSLPMFISGGIIPTYLVMNELGLIDTVWAIIFSGLITTYNVIITRTFVEGIPNALGEAARIDGANDIIILFWLFIPMLKPVIAVDILYYAVTRWNEWYKPMLYLRNRELFPLQLLLREILVQGEMNNMGGISSAQVAMAENIKYAAIIVSTLPILIIYPFLQKYFVQGVMIGAVKG